MLSAIWQVVKLGLLEYITLDHVEELAVLAGADEDLHDLHMMPPDQVLLRWVNYHLGKSGVWNGKPRIETYGQFKDGLAYLVLFNQLNPSSFDVHSAIE